MKYSAGLILYNNLNEQAESISLPNHNFKNDPIERHLIYGISYAAQKVNLINLNFAMHLNAVDQG